MCGTLFLASVAKGYAGRLSGEFSWPGGETLIEVQSLDWDGDTVTIVQVGVGVVSTFTTNDTDTVTLDPGRYYAAVSDGSGNGFSVSFSRP